METMIINKRHELPVSKRLIWDIGTILLWIGWIYLWKPVLIVFYKIIMLDAPVEEISDVIYNEINAVPFENAVFMLIATPIVLFVLSRLNRHVTPTEHLRYQSNEYADYFNVNHAELLECTNSQFITVHHNEQGWVTGLDNQILIK
ncbi:MAG: poly-beta-1,6-N-acetyl-D-glucosamine biosynthesis protein PgaD [Sulfuricurvum sp.]|nr:poly-beta-1,6-N-acetyl-D-glucosamine biosynthesis protein PgaD [Sulfuricurvum sp.]